MKTMLRKNVTFNEWGRTKHNHLMKWESTSLHCGDVQNYTRMQGYIS